MTLVALVLGEAFPTALILDVKMERWWFRSLGSFLREGITPGGEVFTRIEFASLA
jgi:hypothetical protein